MTPEEQRIAIAEACGWKLETRPSHLPKKQVSGWIPPFPAPNGFHEKGIYNTKSLPGYLNDLNAMHEAEKVLTLDQRCRYSKFLHRLSDKPYEDLGATFATAAQRAEAFLRTIGKLLT
jgi:hypothetical protein